MVQEYAKMSTKGMKGLSKSWKVEKTHQGTYTGGKVEISKDGTRMACLFHDDVAFLDALTGEMQFTLQEHVREDLQEEIVTFALRPNHAQIVTASKNLLIRLWDIETQKCLKTIKAHTTPVLAMDFDSSGTLVATGGSDRLVKVFDIEKGFCTHSFRGHEGIVSLVQFHPHPNQLVLVSASEDSTVRVWDLYSQKNVAVFRDHLSLVTSVAFSIDGSICITAGRDKIMNFWDLKRKRLIQTVPVYEQLEGLSILPPQFMKDKDDGRQYVLTAGEKGTLRLWAFQYQDSSNFSCTCTLTQSSSTKDDDGPSLQYTDLLFNTKLNLVMSVTSEQNFIFFDAHMNKQKFVVGYNDEIIDLKYIPRPEEDSQPPMIAVATNSDQIRLMNTTDLSSDVLTGHRDIIMSLAVSPDGQWLASVAKDKTARIWNLQTRRCMCTCIGHTEAVGAVALSPKLQHYRTGLAYFVTGGSDKILKLWTLSELKSWYNNNDEETTTTTMMITPHAKISTKAHEKDINAVAISPNDRVIASASQDKTIKCWSASDLKLLGTCSGHKRGVWSVEFSPVDQCLVSSSGDKTIKIWSAKDFSCLKTFEGHEASVLKVCFATAGMQLVSAGADGLLKLWTIKTNECENTFDAHQDKIWALDVGPKGELMTGGADSKINFWKDTTEIEALEVLELRQNTVLKEQALHNMVQKHDYISAIELAFDLGHPRKLLAILTELMVGPISQDRVVDDIENQDLASLNQFLASLEDAKLHQLLLWIRDWNTNTRTSWIAQHLLSSILHHVPAARLAALENITELFDGLIAYTDRHFQRLDKLVQHSYLVDYSLISMKRLFPQPEEEAEGLEEENEYTTSKRIKCHN